MLWVSLLLQEFYLNMGEEIVPFGLKGLLGRYARMGKALEPGQGLIAELPYCERMVEVVPTQ